MKHSFLKVRCLISSMSGNQIPEKYAGVVAPLCRLYNKTKAREGKRIDPESIGMDTNLKDIGIRKIDMVGMETVLEESYPGIEGVGFARGIKTVRDLINYIEDNSYGSF